jgi:hypothetical protein
LFAKETGKQVLKCKCKKMGDQGWTRRVHRTPDQLIVRQVNLKQTSHGPNRQWQPTTQLVLRQLYLLQLLAAGKLCRDAAAELVVAGIEPC